MPEIPSRTRGAAGLQALVFTLVASTLATIYLTQPTLPLLAREFGVSPSEASLSVSMVILGITLVCLPYGMLADRWPIKRLIALGGTMTALCLTAGALSTSFPLLVAARFGQGLFFPALTSCLAAYLSRTLPPQRLAVAMGAYVSATVVGGLASRLITGLVVVGNWRLAMLLVAALVLGLSLAALRWLPPEGPMPPRQQNAPSYLGLLRAWPTLVPYLTTFGSMFAFASVFNYIPFHLAGPPYGASATFISLLYLTFLLGVALGPMVGWLVTRVGAGPALVGGSLLFMAALLICRLPSLGAVVLGLLLVCGGHFTLHAASQGLLNTRLQQSQGRGNSLYMLVYYLGGWSGITMAGPAWSLAGWSGVTLMGLGVLILPLCVGLIEIKRGA